MQTAESVDKREGEDSTGSSQMGKISRDDVVTAGADNRQSIASQIMKHMEVMNSIALDDITSDNEIVGDDEMVTRDEPRKLE